MLLHSVLTARHVTKPCMLDNNMLRYNHMVRKESFILAVPLRGNTGCCHMSAGKSSWIVCYGVMTELCRVACKLTA